MSRKHSRSGGHKKRSGRGRSDRSDEQRYVSPGHRKGGGGNGGGGNRPPHRGQRRFQDDRPPRDEERLDQAALNRAIDNTQKRLDEYIAQAEALVIERRMPRPKDTELKLDEWQAEAVNAMLANQDVIVDAPTTAGKTRVVESYFHQNIKDPSFRAAYTTPVKSLSNDKVREFREMFGEENVGIATGDIKENLNAPIVVATLECYRNSLLGTEPDLGRNLVVFDEYHFLQDTSRGSAWEESIILTPEHCQLLLLSASVDNAEEFVGWIQKIRPKRTCKLIEVEKRPVPLVDLIHYSGHWLFKDELPEHVTERKGGARPAGFELPIKHEDLVERLLELMPLKLTPCIVYAGRRLPCEHLVTALVKRLKPLPQEESEKIGALLMELHAEKKVLSFITPQLRQAIQSYGVAFHHSGLAIPARYAVETLVKRGLLRFCVATMGLSVGINFAVRSALISDYQRPGEGGFTKYGPSEVLQMLGRAGRRGSDPVGFSLWAKPAAYKRLGGAEREHCESRLRNDPTTFLGLVGRDFSLRDIENFYEKSFRRYRDRGVDFALISAARVMNKLKAETLPCQSPAHEYAKYLREDKTALCYQCPLRKNCHAYLELKVGGDLAALQLHLHIIGALSENDKLTPYGEIAKYFPQNGGLLFAQMIYDKSITIDNLLQGAELMAALSLARFKEMNVEDSYRFPYNPEEIEEKLEAYYPLELFPELYDPPFGRRQEHVLRELNPGAGVIARRWIQGDDWPTMMRNVAADNFGPGDIMAVLYRVTTYLQSLSQAGIGDISRHAQSMRDDILREPLSYTI